MKPHLIRSLIRKSLLWAIFLVVMDLLKKYWFIYELNINLQWTAFIIFCAYEYRKIDRDAYTTFALVFISCFNLYTLVDSLFVCETKIVYFYEKGWTSAAIDNMLYDKTQEIQIWGYYTIAWAIFICFKVALICYATNVPMHVPKWLRK